MASLPRTAQKSPEASKSEDYFKELIMKSRMIRLFTVLLSLLFGIAGSHPATAQSFKVVKVQGGLALTQISSGGASVWALATNGHPYIYKGTQFLLASSAVSLSQISAGGGSLRQSDTVWALDSSGNIYHAVKSATAWTFQQVPGTGVFTQIVAGAGYQDSCHPYEVWGLNSNAQIFRYNFCSGNFDTIAGILCSLAVGGGDIWGMDCSGNVYYYNFAAGFQSAGAVLAEIAVGSDTVFGIDASEELFNLRPIMTPYQSGAIKVAVGDGVWYLDSANHINHIGPTFLEVISGPALTSITVGEGGGVWGLSSGKAYAFSTP